MSAATFLILFVLVTAPLSAAWAIAELDRRARRRKRKINKQGFRW